MSTVYKVIFVVLLLVVGIQTTVIVGVNHKLDTLTSAVSEMDAQKDNKTGPRELARSYPPTSQTPAAGEKYHLVTDKQLRELIQQSQSLQAGHSAPDSRADKPGSEASGPESEAAGRQGAANEFSYRVNSKIEDAISYGKLDHAELNALAKHIENLEPEDRAEKLRQLTQAINRQQIRIDLPQ